MEFYIFWYSYSKLYDLKRTLVVDTKYNKEIDLISRNVVENLVESHLALEEEEDPELYENLILKGEKDVEQDLTVLQDKYLAKNLFLLGETRKL